MEIVDISKLNRRSFKAREIHLTRHDGTTHNQTVDGSRPWIVYNSSSQFSGMPWIDVVNIKSCMGHQSLSLADKRRKCRPKVYRIQLQDEWVSQKRRPNDPDPGLQPASNAACHDITAVGTRIYCAALNATLIIDTAGMTNAQGAVRGTPLPCTLVDGTTTAARVTNCAGLTTATQKAKGWDFLGTVNHTGRHCTPYPAPYANNCNSNTLVESDQDIAVSHEVDPNHDASIMFATDERGGGVVPGGASCQPSVDNPYGNGGIHAYDISDPSNPVHMQDPNGDPAVYIADPDVEGPTFCTVHVIEHIPGENRLVVAYYSQGTRIVDYEVDSNGKLTFHEVAAFILPAANTWAAEDFKIRRNSNGTRTYYFMASDIARGIDIFEWTGLPNRRGGGMPYTTTTSSATTDAGLLVGGLLAVPLAAIIGRKRRRTAA